MRPMIFLVVSLFIGAIGKLAGQTLTAHELVALKDVADVSISKDGRYIAYKVSVPRGYAEKPGSNWGELYLYDRESGESKGLMTGSVTIYEPRISPDGKTVAFRYKGKGDSRRQVYHMPLDGSDTIRITNSATTVEAFRWRPDGKAIAYIAETPETEREETLDSLGYNFIYYEEEWKHQNIYLQELGGDARQLTSNITAWEIDFSPKGDKIAFSGSAKNLIDYKYVFNHIYLLDVTGGEYKQISKNPGKLANFAFSPDGRHIAYCGAASKSDHHESQAYVIPAEGGTAINLTPPNFMGHIEWVGWMDKDQVLYRAAEGTAMSLNIVPRDGGDRTVLLHSEENGNGVIFFEPQYTANLKHVAFAGQTPTHPDELFYWQPGQSPQRLTNLNPILEERELGKQEVYTYKARDGQEIEGILIYPVGYEEDKRYPLIMQVHGGPESHYPNRFVSRYANPGQTLAGEDYLVFFPNYRASTGYGLEFAAVGYGDAAGVEFDDVADGIDALIADGLADKERVGLGGKSYGGYASAWFATYYTEKVNAVCMFVGISDLISKRGTTDIPYEELYVHSGQKLEEMWQQSLERSPIYHAHKSKTATLIYGGADDTRVHPSQSFELYRRMKMNDHPAVRLVQYPGEKHDNNKQTSKLDLCLRQIDWFNWYVRDNKPLDGPMPPLDISDKYGLDLDDGDMAKK